MRGVGGGGGSDVSTQRLARARAESAHRCHEALLVHASDALFKLVVGDDHRTRKRPLLLWGWVFFHSKGFLESVASLDGLGRSRTRGQLAVCAAARKKARDEFEVVERFDCVVLARNEALATELWGAPQPVRNVPHQHIGLRLHPHCRFEHPGAVGTDCKRTEVLGRKLIEAIVLDVVVDLDALVVLFKLHKALVKFAAGAERRRLDPFLGTITAELVCIHRRRPALSKERKGAHRGRGAGLLAEHALDLAVAAQRLDDFFVGI